MRGPAGGSRLLQSENTKRLDFPSNSQWLHPDEINPMFLCFHDRTWEGPYIRENDPLFKFYILSTFVVLNAIGLILLLTEEFGHLALWTEYTFLFVILSLLLPCLWVSYIWDQIIDPHYEMDEIEAPK